MKVIALALGGYVYLLILLIAALALVAYTAYELTHFSKNGSRSLYHWLGLVVWLGTGVTLFFTLVKALWVSMPPLEGKALTAEEAPALFAFLEKVRVKCGGPKLDRVVVDGDFNAGVMQYRDRGILGAIRHDLVIGLPLLMGCSLPQFASVMGHEFGHFSGKHNLLRRWLIRVRTGFWRLLDAQAGKSGLVENINKAFFERYIPYFYAYSFAIGRQNEYEADEAAGRLTSPQMAGDTLCELELKSRFLQQNFWPDVYRQADLYVVPPWHPYQRMRVALQIGLDRQHQAKEWLSEAMRGVTTVDDTHPCLADRLGALQAVARIPQESRTSAAQQLLGEGMGPLIEHFDQQWLASVSAGWQSRFELAQSQRERIQRLINQPVKEAPEWWVLGYLQEDLGDPVAALDCYLKAINRAPRYALGLRDAGRLMCQNDDVQGVALIERAIAEEPGLGYRGSQWVLRTLRNLKADRALINQWEARFYEFDRKESAAWKEILDTHPYDDSDLHNLEPHELRKTTGVLVQERRVRAAWLLVKQSTIFPGRDYYLLVVDESRSSSDVAASLERQITLPGPFAVICANNGVWDMGDKEGVMGRPFYRRR